MKLKEIIIKVLDKILKKYSQPEATKQKPLQPPFLQPTTQNFGGNAPAYYGQCKSITNLRVL